MSLLTGPNVNFGTILNLLSQLLEALVAYMLDGSSVLMYVFDEIFVLLLFYGFQCLIYQSISDIMLITYAHCSYCAHL